MTDKQYKILYLEDEHFLGRIVKESLSSRGFDIKLISDGANFIPHYKSFSPDICVLDIMVPNIDGYTIARELRTLDPDMPIIFLSAKNQTEDVIKGFSAGGNDYLKKPFSMEELIVRVNNLLEMNSRKQDNDQKQTRQLGSFSFDYSNYTIKYGSDSTKLSFKENELLLLLSQNINARIDRKTILNKIWGDDSYYNSRNLDVYIRKLRVLFEKDPSIKLVTLRGVGYQFIIN